MTTLAAFGVGGLLIAGLIALAVLAARKRGRDAARLEHERSARDAAERMLAADVPRSRGDTIDRLRDGRF